MKFQKIRLLLAVIIYTSSLVFPQKENYKIRALPNKQGVATDLVYKMIVDKKGYLWFGTMFGLVKYNGKDYHIYNNNPFDSTTISFDDVISLFEDNEGFLWVGTWGGGLNKFNTGAEKFDRFLYNRNDSSSISSNVINVITQDNLNNLWFGSNDGVLNKYDKLTGTFKKYVIPNSVLKNKNRRHNLITCLFPEGNDLIFCYRGEVLKFNSSNEIFTQYFKDRDAGKVKDKYVNIVYKDSKHNYWLGTYSGLLKYSQDQNFTEVPFKGAPNSSAPNQNIINRIKEDLNNNIWIGTPAGLNKLSRDENSFSLFLPNSNSLKNNIYYSVNDIAVDHEGIVWVSSYRKGLYGVFKDSQIFESIPIDAGSPQSQNYTIKTIAEDKNGNVLTGSFGRGLLKLNKSTGVLENVSMGKLNFNNVNALAFEKDKLWIGSNFGLRVFNFTKQKFEKISFKNERVKNFEGVTITSLLLDSNERIWAGTLNRGLYLINKNRSALAFIETNSDSLSPVANQGLMILNINEDSYGNIWIGTFGGLFKYTPQNSKLILLGQTGSPSKSLSNSYIFSFHEDENGNIWIGTANGLNKLDKHNNEIIKYYKSNGLPSSVITGIAEDKKGNLWLSTNRGISRFNIKKNEFANFGIQDGITYNSFIQSSYLKGSDNKIYFGAGGGLVVVDPGASVETTYSPPLYITSVTFGDNGNKQTTIKNSFGNLEINHDENFINIKFAALDYSYPERIIYEYRLEGLENNWNKTATVNYAQYKNLAPGGYRFLLRASNSGGAWNAAAELNFIILQPFWMQWWFITISILVFCGLAYAAYRKVINNKIKRTLEIERIQFNEREKLKRKTAVDFHDEVGYRLTKISVLSELLKRKFSDKMAPVEEHLNKISEISNEIYTGTKDFIWSLDPENDSVYELFVRLKDFGDEIFNDSKMDFKTMGFSEELNNYFLTTDSKRHLSLIFKEAMNNSVKHSCARQVILSIYVNNKNFKIQLEDDGKGFRKEDVFPGIGLQNMRVRAQKINGSINIESFQDSGTKIIFTGELN